MVQLRITNGFDRLTDAALQVRTAEIMGLMTGNDDFPEPLPTLPDIEDTLADFADAVLNALDGNRQNAAIKNDIRATLISQLHNLGAYVLFVAQGDFLLATSSGFKVAKGPSVSPAITTPTGLSVVQGGNGGELDFEFEKVRNARVYLCQYTPEPLTPQSTWETKTTTMRKSTVSNLQKWQAVLVPCSGCWC